MSRCLSKNNNSHNNIMGTVHTLVCVKQVKQEVTDEWDETMPLPGDIIEGIYNYESDIHADEFFVPTKAKSELSSQLAKISSQHVEVIWVKVRRGDITLKLRARVVLERLSVLHRKYSIRAATDDRHVAVIGDLTSDQCTELQEMSRSLVNVEHKGYNKKGVKYDWKMKMSKYLPDQRCTVVSSILFMPMQGEYGTEATTSRCMAWFSAAVSSGAPLVFVNIQTEQNVTSEKSCLTGKEMSRSSRHGQQQNHATSTVHIVQGIRLWFMPGVAEVSLDLIPQKGETRFGMDIKRTEEGFICINSVAKSSPAERAGLGRLHEEACASGCLLLMSRLESKSLMPSLADIFGLIHCCDHTEIRDSMVSAIDQMESIQVHVMAWSNQARPSSTTPDTKAIGATILRPKPL